jgi:predicted nucleic acid-binding protein
MKSVKIDDDLFQRAEKLAVERGLSADLVRRGRAISAEHGLNYCDGAILAAVERLGCDTVLSEDMSDGQSYGGVTVRNPFGDR